MRSPEPHDKLLEEIETVQTRIKKLEGGLSQLANCKLSDANCASFEVANRRIHNIANETLSH